MAEIAASAAADAGAATAKRSRGAALIDDYLAASPQAAELVRLWEPKRKVRGRLDRRWPKHRLQYSSYAAWGGLACVPTSVQLPGGNDVLVMEVLEGLIRATMVPHRRAAGITLCRAIARQHLRPLYQAINQDRAELKAAALRLLTAVVRQSSASARELQEAFNFAFAVRFPFTSCGWEAVRTAFSYE